MPLRGVVVEKRDWNCRCTRVVRSEEDIGDDDAVPSRAHNHN